MALTVRLVLAAAIGVALTGAPAPLAAQAFTSPQGIGSATVAWQFVDNTGHRGTDGFLVARGQSVTMSALFEVDYGVTDRLSTSIAMPYVFAKYTGGLPSFSRLPRDECKCWHSSFQDVAFGARYRLGDGPWAVTPSLRYGVPSHDYAYQGEAVVGRNLREVQVGVSAGLRLTRLLPKASVQAGYTYSFVEQPVDDIKIDRGTGVFDVGYALTRSLYIRGGANWQRTHGGLRAGSASGNPPFPGDITPALRPQADRLIRSNYWQAGGGLAYAAGPVDLFASITKYVWGRDAHNGQAYTVGTTWYFDLSR